MFCDVSTVQFLRFSLHVRKCSLFTYLGSTRNRQPVFVIWTQSKSTVNCFIPFRLIDNWSHQQNSKKDHFILLWKLAKISDWCLNRHLCDLREGFGKKHLNLVIVFREICSAKCVLWSVLWNVFRKVFCKMCSAKYVLQSVLQNMFC